jgi:hypothetical protein
MNMLTVQGTGAVRNITAGICKFMGCDGGSEAHATVSKTVNVFGSLSHFLTSYFLSGVC